MERTGAASKTLRLSQEWFLKLLRLRRTLELDGGRPFSGELERCFTETLATLDEYLYQVAGAQTDDVQMAVVAAESVKARLLKKAFSCAEAHVFESKLARALWNGRSPRAWVFLEVCRTVRRLRDKPRRLLPLWEALGCPPIPRLPPAAAATLNRSRRPVQECVLGRSEQRRRFMQFGLCHGGCAVLVMDRLDIRGRELAEALEVSPARASAYEADCTGLELDRRASMHLSSRSVPHA